MGCNVTLINTYLSTNWWVLKIKLTKLSEEQKKKASEHFLTDFTFVSDWSRGRCKFTGLITEESKKKLMLKLNLSKTWLRSFYLPLALFSRMLITSSSFSKREWLLRFSFYSRLKYNLREPLSLIIFKLISPLFLYQLFLCMRSKCSGPKKKKANRKNNSRSFSKGKSLPSIMQTVKAAEGTNVVSASALRYSHLIKVYVPLWFLLELRPNHFISKTWRIAHLFQCISCFFELEKTLA